MRRLFFAVLTVLMLFGGASANQWGVEGELLAFFHSTDDYDDCTYVDHNYTGPHQQTVAMVVSTEMNSRLVLLERNAAGILEQTGCYPRAVALTFPGYGDRWDMQTLADDGFSMTRINGGKEAEKLEFIFLDGEPVLRFARLTYLTYSDGMTFTLTENGYAASDGVQTVTWQVPPIPLAQFQLGHTSLPANPAEVWEDNMLRACLPELSWLTEGTAVDLNMKKQPAVYSAPAKNALRGAKGKAAVSLQEPFNVLAVTPDQSWWLVYYDISPTQRRIGYIQSPADPPEGVRTLSDAGVTIRTGRLSGLMDDPWYSGSSVGSLKKGTEVTVLGWTDAFFAYAEGESDGKLMRGFIPLDRLRLPESLRRREIERRLAGQKIASSDGEITFLPDGRCMLGEDEYTCEVYANDPSVSGPWDGCTHVLVLRNSAGFTECYGMAVTEGRLPVIPQN